MTESLRERPVPWAPPPNGYHYEVVEAPHWVTPAIGAGRCRYGGGGGHRACGRPAVASLLRLTYRRGGSAGVPWDYCDEPGHMFGRWLEDGKVVGWRLVEGVE